VKSCVGVSLSKIFEIFNALLKNRMVIDAVVLVAGGMGYLRDSQAGNYHGPRAWDRMNGWF
jgi:hypothetical protein